jgi:hypothetical protein
LNKHHIILLHWYIFLPLGLGDAICSNVYQHLLSLFFMIRAILTLVIWYIIVVLIYILLLISVAELFSIGITYIFGNCMSSSIDMNLDKSHYLCFLKFEGNIIIYFISFYGHIWVAWNNAFHVDILICVYIFLQTCSAPITFSSYIRTFQFASLIMVLLPLSCFFLILDSMYDSKHIILVLLKLK